LQILNTPQLDVVISVCCLRDAKTWQITSGFIVQNIHAKQYKVFVPDGEVEAFRAISALPFQVVGESIYTKDFAQKLRKCLPEKIQDQFGWYLQQLIKLTALSQCNEDQFALIWDADTVPIKPLHFIDEAGKLIYYKSDEFHPPYFLTIDKLLGLKKIVNFSFIAQSFVMRGLWMKQFINAIEARHGIAWVDAILEAIDFQEGNGFSEYETLGTFITHTYPAKIHFTDRQWLRWGNSTIGDVAFLKLKSSLKKLKQYDFVSFEKWDRMKPYFWKVKIPYFFYIFLPKFFRNK